MNELIEKQFWKIIQQEELDNPSWVVELQEDDEPPLFTRYEQVEFLQDIPSAERGKLVLRTSIALLERIADFIAISDIPSEQRIFCCVTFTDFEEWKQGEQLVPTPALYVRPHDEKLPIASCRFVTAQSINGKEVERWLQQIDSELSTQFCVVELNTDEIDSGAQRVYVGWRTNPSEQLVSVGDSLYYEATVSKTP